MCEGAIIAYTVAKQLENAGEKVELLFIIDAWARENTRNPLLYKFTKYQNALRKVRGLSSPERRRALENALRNRLRWLVSGKEESQRVLDDVYWPGKDFAPTKINARIVVFKAPQQYFGYINDELMGWGERTTAHVEVQLVPGSKHRFLLREPFVRQIASALVKDLERTAGEQAGAATEVAVP
jgi:thioesterase domain-containing protein